MRLKYTPAFTLFSIVFLFSCSTSKQIGKQAEEKVLKNTALTSAHVGISIYEPATGKYWYNHDADKYFIPASNTKIFTCYSAMKYLGDSLPGLTYYDFDTAIYIQGTGDPTLLHPDFTAQPVIDFLKRRPGNIYLDAGNWRDERWGNGWAWNDYNEDYMAEKSVLPVYGNVIRLSLQYNVQAQKYYSGLDWKAQPKFFLDALPAFYYMPLKVMAQRVMKDTLPRRAYLENFMLKRAIAENKFELVASGSKFNQTGIPIFTDTANTAIAILRKEKLLPVSKTRYIPFSIVLQPEPNRENIPHIIKSQPTDSMLKPMMHRSDNFFAEQVLLMISNSQLGYMNTGAIIDTILNKDFKGIPQKPRWVDGSGLSRYNLFTPQSIVWVLNKMHSEFSFERIKEIMATGGEGTLNNYYTNLKGKIFAKTGTLSNHCALSGFLITKKGKLLIFSVLTGSYPGGATAVRKAVEQFIVGIYEKY